MLRPAAAAIVALAACRTLPVPSAIDARPAVAIAPTAEVVARPGEQMSYRVRAHGLDVAELVVSVGEPTTLDGAAVIPVQMRTTSVKVLGWFQPLDDTLTSWLDRATGRPVAYRTSTIASRDADDVEDTETRFAPGLLAVRVVRGGATTEATQTVDGHGYDVPSILTFLRGWDGAPGDQVTVDLMRTRHAMRTSLVVAGFENVSTPLGDLPAVRYDGQSQRLARDGTVDAGAGPRRFSVWITDDADRVPARVVAATDLGELTVELAAYTAH